MGPILFLLKADKPKNIATNASFFILLNSISGVFGQLTKENIINEFERLDHPSLNKHNYHIYVRLLILFTDTSSSDVNKLGLIAP